MNNVQTSRLTSTFLELVKIDSPTGHEENISNHLFHLLKLKGYEVIQDSVKNVFLNIPGSGEPLFISAHMDTVEPGKNVEPIISGDLITSTGKTILGADNKSTITVILGMLEAMREKNIKTRPLEILFTIDEESSSKGAIYFDYTKLQAKKGIISDIAESLGVVVLASPAYSRFDITLIGQSGHAAYPDKATNVLDALSDVLKIKKGRLDESTTLNIGIIEAGTARNTIPGEAKIHGEIRSYSQELLERHMQNTVSFIENVASNNGVKVDIGQKQDNPGYIFEENDKYVQEVASVLKSCGFEPSFIKSPSVSDANEFNVHGLQVVNIGDGTQKTHTVDERIKISDMEKLLEIFLAFVVSKG